GSRSASDTTPQTRAAGAGIFRSLEISITATHLHHDPSDSIAYIVRHVEPIACRTVRRIVRSSLEGLLQGRRRRPHPARAPAAAPRWKRAGRSAGRGRTPPGHPKELSIRAGEGPRAARVSHPPS